MTEKDIKLTIGALLHDIGKVVFRNGTDKRNHSVSGHDFLKENLDPDEEILSCVRFHHSSELRNADIDKDSLAYIVYIADNISAAADRRARENGKEGFEQQVPLSPVFNILNGNDKEMYYSPDFMDFENSINYPVSEKKLISESVYKKICIDLLDNLKNLEFTENYLNSLLEVLEANLSFVPSSTSRSELPDISLFDHVKLTGAIAGAIKKYLDDKGVSDYREALYTGAQGFYDEDSMLLASVDISGIQSFIYTITTKNALKTLRARSFYLEILMEHMIDELLERIGLSRANLIYSGGGHCYILLPNTDAARERFDECISDMNRWLLEEFGTGLYMAGAYTPCSGNTLQNIPDGSYTEMFRSLSGMLSRKKRRRYTPDDIRRLNGQKIEDDTRECVVCRRIKDVNSEGRCDFCQSIEAFSKNVLYAEMFSVTRIRSKAVIPISRDCYLRAENEDSLKERMNSDGFVRAYSKNKLYSGQRVATKLWVGDYTTGETLSELSSKSDGIDRLGVLRADVDNLGQTIVSGFKRNGDSRYMTLSRTATLSRKLSLFFKHDINLLLEGKNVSIVYSGGDDVFIVGAWNEIIDVSILLHEALDRFSEGSLTISGGIGIYESSYPISVIAREVAESEEKSKHMEGKDAITIFEDMTVHWNDLRDDILGEKLACIEGFLDRSVDKGKAFIYKLLELIRNQEDRINFARYVYLLSRMEDGNEMDQDMREHYNEFRKKMMEWIVSDKDRRMLEAAIMIYVYRIRERDVMV